MARPHLFFDWQEENRSGLDILLAVDCSKSMLTEDVKPNRIERAKLAIADFADHLPDNRLGLIAFAGDAFLQCPLTLDHDAFQTAVRELDTDTIPRPGTDIATAIDQAVDALRSQPNNMKFLILVTDGEDLEGRVLDAAKNAAQNGLKIYTVGVGTANGDRIPGAGRFRRRRLSPAMPAARKWSRSSMKTPCARSPTSPAAPTSPLGQRGEGLDEIYSRYIAPLPKQNLEERREKIPIERFEWPLALAILLLMWEFMIQRTGEHTRRQPLRLLPARPAAPCAATDPNYRCAPLRSSRWACSFSAPRARLRRRNRECRARLTNRANTSRPSKITRRPPRSNPRAPNSNTISGDAAYKSGDYSEAEEEFRKALETPDLGLQEKSYYNLGNAQFEHGAIGAESRHQENHRPLGAGAPFLRLGAQAQDHLRREA